MPVGNGMHAETPMHFAGGKRLITELLGDPAVDVWTSTEPALLPAHDT